MSSELQSTLKMNEPLRCAVTAISDLIEESTYASHLKDIQTGKYIQANSRWMENLGFESSNDFIGLNVNDFAAQDGIWTKWNFSPFFNAWKDSIPEKVNELEYQIRTKREVLCGQCLSFTSEGFILIEEWMKLPILSQDRKKAVALLSYNHDVTLRRSLFALFQLYREYHAENNAIRKLLMYLNIDGYFTELPTLEEMNVLLAIHQHYDLLSEKNVSVRKSLQDKVEKDYWHEMLMRLYAVPMNIH